jgi:hypothetical protein
MSVVYMAGRTGELFGPIALIEVPGVGVQVPEGALELAKALKPAATGFVWALVEGTPQQLADHRGIVYRTEDGGEVRHEELGALPDGLTATAWPGRFYIWSGDAWVLDEAAQLEAAQEVERTWRNAQIAASDYLAMPDYPITAEQRSQLYGYRQALRNWPAAGQFPNPTGRPSPPAWIADLSE